MTKNFKNILTEVAFVPNRAGMWGFREGCFSFEVNNFGNSGKITLVEKGDIITAYTMYNTPYLVYSFDDIVYIAYKWWIDSKDNSDFYSQPPDIWVDDFIRLGYIEKVTKTVTEYKIK
jgi:hypothetical protein